MKLIAACFVASVAIFVAICCSNIQFAAAAVASGSAAQQHHKPPHIGLYAPDRYDGIPEMCLMPMDFGHCRAKVKRYYFDVRRMKCAMFYFGGCAGNINNFKSLDECNKFCLDDNYIEEEEDNNSNSNRNSNYNDNNNNNNNSNKPNINKIYNFKPNLNSKNEQRRIGNVNAKTNDNNNNNNQQNDEEEEEEYQQ